PTGSFTGSSPGTRRLMPFNMEEQRRSSNVTYEKSLSYIKVSYSKLNAMRATPSGNIGQLVPLQNC
ncbi:MAG TPA: hypothetical protein VJQ25_12785, partial [Nitrospira sp.]|nr:hypothetical protein [Nitrospira sp.]